MLNPKQFVGGRGDEDVVVDVRDVVPGEIRNEECSEKPMRSNSRHNK